MTIDDKIRDKNKCNMILTEKQQLKLLNLNILQVKKFYLLTKGK